MPGAASYTAEVTNLCVPEVTIADDGTISGECEQSDVRGHLVTSVNFTAMVIGQVDPSGKVSFTYEVSEIGLQSGSWRWIIQEAELLHKTVKRPVPPTLPTPVIQVRKTCFGAASFRIRIRYSQMPLTERSRGH